MTFFKRIIYLFYYGKTTSFPKLLRFWRHAKKEANKPGMFLWMDCLYAVFRYNISLLEYFQFRFYTKTHHERLQWAGTGFMYEFQRLMNPPSQRVILDDKTRFFKAYAPFVKHVVADKEALQARPELFAQLTKKPAGKIVLKTTAGKCGRGVEIHNTNEFTGVQALLRYMVQNDFSVVEEYIVQHNDLQRLSPSAVNTVRIFTQLDADNNVHLLGCRQRISVGKDVDNMAAGNLAAPIDPETGTICAAGVYSDITKTPETVHPLTGVALVGFPLPFWEETVAMVKKAALWQPQNRSIGWDVVITNEGPGLIEGNHDWCKLVLQLPDDTGRRHQLETFLHDYQNRKDVLPNLLEAVA